MFYSLTYLLYKWRLLRVVILICWDLVFKSSSKMATGKEASKWEIGLWIRDTEWPSSSVNWMSRADVTHQQWFQIVWTAMLPVWWKFHDYEMVYNKNIFGVCKRGVDMGAHCPSDEELNERLKRRKRWLCRVFRRIIEFLLLFHRNSLATDSQCHRLDSVERPSEHPPSCFKLPSGMMTSQLRLMQLS